MNRQSRVVLAILCFALASSVASAQKAEAKESTPEVYSGKIMALSGMLAGKPTDLAVVVGGYSRPFELERYQHIIEGKDGQSKLAETLGGEYDLGAYRLGTELALAIKLITVQETAIGRRLTLVGTRIPQGRELEGRLGPRDYRFVVITLNVDSKGSGEGSYIPSAKLRFNDKHLPEVEDYQTQPAAITKVKLEHSAR